MYDNLKLIQSKINSEEDQPISQNHSDKVNRYDQVLTRIYGNIKEVKESMLFLQKSQRSQSIAPSSRVSTLNFDVQKNHQALRSMIEMIDNRPTTRFTDRNQPAQTNRAERSNRFIEEEAIEVKKVRKKEERKDLEEVRDNLRRVIDLIDTKLTKDGSMQIQTRKELNQIRQAVDRQELNIRDQMPNNQAIDRCEVLIIPKMNSFTSQLSSNQFIRHDSNMADKSQNKQQQYLNLKVSFDQMNELQFQHNNRSPIGRNRKFQKETPQFVQQSPRQIRPMVVPQRIDNTPVHQLTFESSRRNQPLQIIHVKRDTKNTEPPIYTRYQSPPLNRDVHSPSRYIRFNHSSKPPQFQKAEYIRPTLKESAYSNLESEPIDTRDYVQPHLKQSFKPKAKYSFSKQPPLQQVQFTRFDLPQARDTMDFGFPDPFISEDRTMDNPFINYESSPPKPKMLNSKISLKSILEVSEESRRMDDMYRSGNSLAIEEQYPSLQLGSTVHRKKGIQLTYPTYQTHYFPHS